jgi:LEA14-like dessication related protein
MSADTPYRSLMVAWILSTRETTDAVQILARCQSGSKGKQRMRGRSRLVPPLHGLAAVMLALAVACAGPGRFLEKPSFSVAAIRIEKIGLVEEILEIDVRVLNPNDVSFILTGVEADLEVAKQHLARGVSQARITVPARGTAIVPLTMYASLGDMWKVSNSQRREGRKVHCTLTGRLHTSGGFLVPDTIPFAAKGTFSLWGKDEHQGMEKTEGAGTDAETVPLCGASAAPPMPAVR